MFSFISELKMDLIKQLVGPSGINLLTEECSVKYLDEFDILDQDCFKATLAKALGLAIIAGSILVKVFLENLLEIYSFRFLKF